MVSKELIFTAAILLCLCCSTFDARACYEGHLNITFHDTTLNRDIDAIIYYNADRDTGEAQTIIGTANNSIPMFSVVVLGHGYQIPWSAYHSQAYNIILHFYTQVVIVPKSTSGAAPNHMDFARDMVACLQYMQREGTRPGSMFYGHINNDNVFMGHSMGGGCALLAAKYAIQNTNLFVRSIILLAPAETTPSAVAASASINCPTLIIAGDKDCITPLTTTVQPMYEALGAQCKSLVMMPGASHCQFADSNALCSLAESPCQGTLKRSVQLNNSYLYINSLLSHSDLFARKQDISTVQTSMTLFVGGDIIASRNNVCVGDTVRLESKTALPQYLWLPDSVRTPVYYFIPKKGRNYVSLVNQQCFGNTVAQYTVDAGKPEQVRITGNYSVCLGDSTTLELTNPGFTDPEWSTGQKGRIISVHEPGKYIVKAWDALTCSYAIDSILVRQLATTKAGITVSGDTSFCEGFGQVKVACTVDTNIFKTYQWSTGDNTPYIILNSGGSHKVWARVHSTSPNYCDAFSDTVSIDLHGIVAPKPTLKRVYNTLVASQGDSYTWYKGTALIYDWHQATYSPYELGMYSVVVGYNAYANCSAKSDEFNYDQQMEVAASESQDLQLQQSPDRLTVIGCATDEMIRVYSILGDVVFEQRANSAQVSFDCSQLSKGSYYLQCTNHSRMFKVMIH